MVLGPPASTGRLVTIPRFQVIAAYFVSGPRGTEVLVECGRIRGLLGEAQADILATNDQEAPTPLEKVGRTIPAV